MSGDGNTLAVGAWIEGSAATGINGDQQDNSAPLAGAVYVFARFGNGWEQQAYVKASNTSAGDLFGYKLALSNDGNTLAVGAQDEDSSSTGIDNNQLDDCFAATPVACAVGSGAVYVYTRRSNTWTQQAYIKASNTGAGDHFGWPVSLSRDGNILAVGAAGQDSNAIGLNGDQANDAAIDSGAVYVFVRSDTAWAQQAYIKASNTESGDFFGYALALSGSGTTLAVGAQGEDGAYDDPTSNAVVDSGAVYVYSRSGSAWITPTYIKASTPGANDQFGYALALSDDGDTLAVGAYFEDSPANSIGGDSANDCSAASPTHCSVDSGAAYVYTRGATTWTAQAYLKASNANANDWFGFAVALSGDGRALAVSANREGSGARGINGDNTNNAEIDSGAVYFFVRHAEAWIQQAYVKASNTGVGDGFGGSVGLSDDGNTLAVGAARESSNATGLGGDQSDNSIEWAGAVYIY